MCETAGRSVTTNGGWRMSAVSAAWIAASRSWVLEGEQFWIVQSRPYVGG
jgi:hypothetical protein